MADEKFRAIHAANRGTGRNYALIPGQTDLYYEVVDTNIGSEFAVAGGKARPQPAQLVRSRDVDAPTIGATPITPGGGGGGGSGLQTLILSANKRAAGAPPSTLIGTVSGMTPGSEVFIVPNDGRLALGSAGQLVGGLSSSAVGDASYKLRERHPLYGVRETDITITTEAITPLDPNALTGMAAAYSNRLVVPGWTGGLGGLRDSGNTARVPTFDPVTKDCPKAQFAAWGDGTTFTQQSWYDQTGNNRPVTTSAQPKFLLDAMANGAGTLCPAVDFLSKNVGLSSAASFVDFSEGKYVSIFVVAETMGWSSAGTHPRNPGVLSANAGAIVSYGTSGDGEALITGATSDLGETRALNSPDAILDEGVPINSRQRNLWINAKNGVLSGGADTRQAFADRAIAPAFRNGARRIVIGSVPAANQSFNGRVYEVIVFVRDTPLTDLECRRIALWQRQYWGAIADATIADRHHFTMSGQSLIQYLDTVASFSGGGSDPTTYARRRVIEPDIRSHLEMSAYQSKTLTATCNTTAYGGTNLLKWPNVTDHWWNQDTNSPGNLATQWLANLKSGTITALASIKLELAWGQGENDIWSFSGNGETGSCTYANWVTSTINLIMWMRQQTGQVCPVVIQPLGRNVGYDVMARRLRGLQNQIVAGLANCVMGPEIAHLVRAPNDGVHLAAGPAEPNGFDRSGLQLAHVFARQFGADVGWRGPRLTAAKVIDPTTIDLAVEYPLGCKGTDIKAEGGGTTGFLGFEVTGKTVTSAARVDAKTIRLTGSGFAANDLVQYNPMPTGLDRLKLVVDNYAEINMPLRQAFDLVAA